MFARRTLFIQVGGTPGWTKALAAQQHARRKVASHSHKHVAGDNCYHAILCNFLATNGVQAPNVSADEQPCGIIVAGATECIYGLTQWIHYVLVVLLFSRDGRGNWIIKVMGIP